MKSKTLLLTLFMLLTFSMVRAEIVQVGELGYNRSNYLPTYTYFNYSLTQQVYSQDEVGSSAYNITSLSFFNDGQTRTRNIDIYLKHVNDYHILNYIDVASSDKVFSGSVTFVGADWTTITLNTPFAFNGTNDLLVTIDDNTGSFESGASFRTYSQTSHQAIYVYSDQTNYDPTAASSYTGTRENYKPQIKINGNKLLGESRISNLSLPMYSGDKYAQSQQIYTAAEIGKAGTIKSISLYSVYPYNKTRNIDIYLKHTDKTVFSITNTQYTMSDDWVGVSTSNKVFSGSVTFVSENWTTITFDTPFEYNGTDNLALIVDDNTGTGNLGLRCLTFYTSEQQSLYVFSNDENFDPTNMSGIEGHLPNQSQKNVIKLDIDSSDSGETIQVGSGTETNYGMPIYTNWNYGLTQQIYTVAEVDHTGTITSIAFKSMEDIGQARTIDIYLVKTNKSSFSSSDDYISAQESDKVFSGSVTFAVGEWTTIPFDKPFEYDGSANLCLIVNDKTGSYLNGSAKKWLVYPGTGQSLLRINDNYGPYDPATPGSVMSSASSSSSVLDYKSQLQLTFGGGGGDETIQVGSGDKTNWPLPLNTGFQYSFSQQIYRSAEIGKTGTITSVGFKIKSRSSGSTTPVTRNIDLYLVKTNKTYFVSNDDWINVSESDKVFSGDVTFAIGDWTTITLNKPFEYDGSENLCLVTNDKTGSGVGESVNWCVEYGTYTAVIYYLGGSSPHDPASLPTADDCEKFKNQIQLTFGSGGGGGGDDDDLVIGSGEATSEYLPTYSYYNNSLTQQIYTASELGAAKDLTSISFYNAGSEKTRNLDIYLVPTTKTSFAIADAENLKSNDWISFTEADKVFSGEVTFTENEWTAIPFLKTFSYNGTTNLALIVDDNTGSYSRGLACRVFDANNQAIRIYSDGTNYNAGGLSSYSGTILSVKNQLKLNEVGVAVAPSSITVTDIEWNSATVTWESEGSSWNLQYKTSSASEWTSVNGLTTKSYTLTDLDEYTTYAVRVQIDNGDGTGSSFVSTQLTTPERFPRPAGLKVLSVAPFTAVLDWTDNCGATKWQTYVYDGTNEVIYGADSKPYILTGLNQGTEYQVWVRAVIDADNDLYSRWSEDYIYFETPLANPAPTDIAVTTTPTSATITWEGKSDKYVVKYRKVTPIAGDIFDFDDGTLQGWTTIDADGDGYTWASSSEPGDYHHDSVDLTGTGHDGSAHYVLSGSYSNSNAVALTPDNYLVSPLIELGGKIRFYACAQDPDYAAEHFGVAVSTTSNTDASAFTTIEEWTMTASGKPSSRRKAQGTWGLFEVDLSAYAGNTGYVAIRHFNCTNQFILNVDDINIDSEAGFEPWQTIETTDKTVTIDGLEADVTYEYEIVGISKGNEDASTGIGNFTTLAINATPFDVYASTTNTTATISWKGYSDGYVVRYREVIPGEPTFFEDFEGCTDGALPTGWTAIDADGDEYNWYTYSPTEINDGNENPYCFDNTTATSASYINDIGVLTPDNWLITPQLDLHGFMSVWLRGLDPSYAAEHFAIYLSLTGTDVDDFTTVLVPETIAKGVLTEYTADLGAYEGQKGYIAIRHFNVTDMYRLNMDNFSIYVATYGEWQMEGGFDTKITIEGLKPDTNYQYYVTGIQNEGGTGIPGEPTGFFSFKTKTSTPIDLTLDNDASNGSILKDNDGAYANVTINNLTLKKDGKWHAIYLPFEVGVENSILAGADVRTLESATQSSDVLILNCLTPVTKMAAGVPYIIKWDNGENIINPVFNDVSISAYEGKFTVDGVMFDEVSYNATYASQNYPACYLVTGDPILSYITTGITLPAFEPYFYIDEYSYSCNTVVLNTGDVDDLIDGISSLKGNTDEVIYNLAGQRLAKKQKGVNIINGRKVLVK